MNIFIIVQPFAAVCFAFRPSFSHYFCLFLIWFSCLTTLIVILPFSSYCYLYPSYFIHLSHLLAPSPWTVQYCHVLALTDTITLLFSWNLMLNASRLSPIYNSVDWPLFPTTRGFIYQLIQSVRCTSVVRTRVNVSDQIDRGTYIRDGLFSQNQNFTYLSVLHSHRVLMKYCPCGIYRQLNRNNHIPKSSKNNI